MAEYEAPHRFLEPGLLGKWLAKRGYIWQMDLLDANALSSFVEARGLDFWRQHIEQLWQLGLLKADLVVTTRKCRRSGLLYMGLGKRGERLYADERQPRPRARGWGNARLKLRPVPSGVKPLFHPFRYYVLYHLHRLFGLGIVRMQMLSVEYYPRALSNSIDHFQLVSASPTFLQNIEHWNDTVALAVATEPCFYHQVFGGFSYSEDRETHLKAVEDQEADLVKCYQRIKINSLEQIRQEICVAAESLDQNTDVHTVLRLAEDESRLKLTDHLGGAIYLLTMAELLRRAAERADRLCPSAKQLSWGRRWCVLTLREEDELGFGWTPLNMKRENYGSNRIFDDYGGANEFLRHLRLDYGVRLRWYVEGYTEYFALKRIFEDFAARYVEVKNLRGKFIEKDQLAFRESLRDDMRSGVFSWVSFDGDRSDNLRVVRTAAKQDEMYGMFFVSNPDFEFGNFTLSELEDVLWNIASEKGALPEERMVLHTAIAPTKSGKELLRAAAHALPTLHNISKNADWGEHLIRYAWQHRIRTDGELRHITWAVETALNVRLFNYSWERRTRRVNPETGMPVEVSSEEG